MPSQYVQAKHCQLFRTDLEALLLLPTCIVFSFQELGEGPYSEKVGTRIHLPTLGGVLSAFLTETHVHASIVNSLVRVLVPNNKREALLLDNPYVQQQQQEESKKRDENKDATDMANESNAQTSPAQRSSFTKNILHRVGRVVALLPKPKKTNQGSQNDSASQEEELLSSWLLAVHLGEKIELFPIQCVSNEVLSEPEHSVYLHSTLGKYSTTRPSARSAASNTADNFILIGEQVEAVKSHLEKLRVVFEGVRLYQQQRKVDPDADALRRFLSRTATQLGIDGRLASLKDAPAFKRSRADGSSKLQPESAMREEVQGPRKKAPDHQADEETELEQARYFGTGELSEATRSSRFNREKERLTQQLEQLRQMLQNRDESLSELHKQLRQAEEQHKSELSQWRLKEMEESKAHERVVLDYHTKLKENEALLQKADQKLRELAKMTVKYKSVSDEFMRRTGLKGKSPEEVLALLKDDKYSVSL